MYFAICLRKLGQHSAMNRFFWSFSQLSIIHLHIHTLSSCQAGVLDGRPVTMCLGVTSLQCIRRRSLYCDPGMHTGPHCVWQTSLCCLWPWRRRHTPSHADGADICNRFFFLFFSLLPWAPYVFPVLLYRTGDLSMEESCLPSAYWHGLQLLK